MECKASAVLSGHLATCLVNRDSVEVTGDFSRLGKWIVSKPIAIMSEAANA